MGALAGAGIIMVGVLFLLAIRGFWQSYFHIGEILQHMDNLMIEVRTLSVQMRSRPESAVAERDDNLPPEHASKRVVPAARKPAPVISQGTLKDVSIPELDVFVPAAEPTSSQNDAASETPLKDTDPVEEDPDMSTRATPRYVRQNPSRSEPFKERKSERRICPLPLL